jgi:hypothetical protein
MKTTLLMIFCSFFLSLARAEEKKILDKPQEKVADEQAESQDAYKRIDYAIDWKYKAGEYFIYDCKREYYACVDSEGYDRCVEDRKNSITKGKSKYDCAPLKQFPDKRACIVYNYSIIERVATKLFCFPK